MRNRYFLFLMLSSFFSINLVSQEWVDKMHDPNANFYDIQKAFNAYWKDKPYEKGKGYKQYKRWEEYAEPRVYPSGDLKYASQSYAWEQYQKFLSENPITSSVKKSSAPASLSGNWTALGPFGSPLNGDAGRLQFIRFHPTLPNTIYVGAAAGGLWITTDGGTTWTTNTNSLAVLGCADIAISSATTSIMYLATGDLDHGDTYSTGILKSTDGGISWSTTGLAWTASQLRRIGRVLINPLRQTTIVAATSDGIYRSNNSGVSWVQVKTGNYLDIEYKPGDTSTVYTVTKNEFWKSTSGGNTAASFTLISAGITPSNTKMCVSVTPADANYVYVLNSASDYSYGGLFRSTNSGTSFTKMSSTPNIFDWSTDGSGSGGQGWYDLACGVSPTNKNEVICGGVNTWMSLDGGATWSLNTHWYGGGGAPYVHADCHAIEYQTGSKIFLGTDGGFAVSSDGGSTWTTKNGTMDIAQIYKMGQSVTNPNYVLSGHQDNGANLLNGGSWEEVHGGDGMDCFVDWSDDKILVESYVYGDYNRSTDRGVTWTNIAAGIPSTLTAAWVAPIIQSPFVSTTYFAGYNQVVKTTNSGSTWTQLGVMSPTANLLYITAAPSNSLVLYAGYGTVLFKTVDGGATWTRIDAGLPVGSANITDIDVCNIKSTDIFVTFSGYSSGNKVFSSKDGGATWTNISTGLPNLPVNCVKFEKGSAKKGIYVGTDVGVYYKDTTMAAFTPFMTGLPNVIVKDFEIYYATGKIRAATFGRGVWQSDLYSNPSSAPTALFSYSPLTVCKNGAVTFTDYSTNSPVSWSWNFQGASPATSSLQNPVVTFTSTGTRTVSLVATNGGGSSIMLTKTISVVASPTTPTVTISGVVLTSSSPSSNQWYLNGSPISGAIFQNYTMLSSGNYHVVVSNASGCTTSSTVQFYEFDPVALQEKTFMDNLIVSPNPAKDIVRITSNTNADADLNYEIFSTTGQLVSSGKIHISPSNNESIFVGNFAKGVYELKFTVNDKVSRYTFVKE